MEVQAGDPVGGRLEDHPGSGLGEAAAAGLEVVDLQDDHVAAVAAALGEEAPGGRARLGRRHDLQQLVAHRVQNVSEAEPGHAGVPEAGFEAEVLLDVRLDGGEVRGHEGHLSKADPHPCGSSLNPWSCSAAVR